MKLKQIHDFLKSIVTSLIVKRDRMIKDKLPKLSIEYAEGQLYEAQYILDIFEKVLYENMKDIEQKSKIIKVDLMQVL